MPTIAELLAQADIARPQSTIEVPVCVVPDLALARQTAEQALDRARRQLDAYREQASAISASGEHPTGRRKLGDAAAPAQQVLEQAVADAEQALTDADTRALAGTFIYVFRRLPGTEFLPLRARYTTATGQLADGTQTQKLGDALMAASFDHVETPDGTRLDDDWESAAASMPSGLYGGIGYDLIVEHSAAVTVPFDLARSATRTSS